MSEAPVIYNRFFFEDTPKFSNNLDIHIFCNIFVVQLDSYIDYWDLFFKMFRMSYFSDFLSVL